jgi:hypothetical protein
MDASRGPFEECHAEALFDALHLPRDSALSEPGQFRRLRETAMLRYQVEEVQFVDIEGRRFEELMHERNESMALMNFTPKRKSRRLRANHQLYG